MGNFNRNKRRKIKRFYKSNPSVTKVPFISLSTDRKLKNKGLKVKSKKLEED